MSLDFARLTLGPCVKAFGDVVIYTPGAGAPVTVGADGNPLRGIFNEFSRQEKTDDTTGMLVIRTYPTVALQMSDLVPGAPPPCQGEMIGVAGRNWTIVETDFDSAGRIWLRLHKTP
jgi:hypothetical protein